MVSVTIVLAAQHVSRLDAATKSSRESEAWFDLQSSMDRMHHAMAAEGTTGSSDADFVRLMLPHHQAAIDMAKAEILYGKDPQVRRLAQEIITDQHAEIELMQHWLASQQSQKPH